MMASNNIWPRHCVPLSPGASMDCSLYPKIKIWQNTLDDEFINACIQWINSGASDSRKDPPSTAEAEKLMGQSKSEELGNWWSLKPIVHPTVPQVNDVQWSHSQIDRFLLARLEKKGLKHSLPNSRTTMIRRVSLSLNDYK